MLPENTRIPLKSKLVVTAKIGSGRFQAVLVQSTDIDNQELLKLSDKKITVNKEQVIIMTGEPLVTNQCRRADRKYKSLIQI